MPNPGALSAYGLGRSSFLKLRLLTDRKTTSPSEKVALEGHPLGLRSSCVRKRTLKPRICSLPYLTRAYPEDLGIFQKAYPRFPPILLVRHSQSKRTGENFSRRGDGKQAKLMQS